MEAVIGLSAIAVPAALDWGRAALAGAAGASWGSSNYYVASDMACLSRLYGGILI